MKREDLTPELIDWIYSSGMNKTIPDKRMADEVVIGRFTPQMLNILKCSDHLLLTSISHLEKMIFDHGLTASQLKRLHGIICQPEKIFQSASHPQTAVVVMTVEVLRAKPILVPIHLNKPGPAGKAPAHWVSSAYPKDHPEMLAKWAANGLLIWSQK